MLRVNWTNDKHSKLYYIEQKIGRYIIIKITVHKFILKYQLKFKIYKIINFLTADCTKMDWKKSPLSTSNTYLINNNVFNNLKELLKIKWP